MHVLQYLLVASALWQSATSTATPNVELDILRAQVARAFPDASGIAIRHYYDVTGARIATVEASNSSSDVAIPVPLANDQITVWTGQTM